MEHLDDIIKALTAIWLIIQIVAKLKEIFTKPKESPSKPKTKSKKRKK